MNKKAIIIIGVVLVVGGLVALDFASKKEPEPGLAFLNEALKEETPDDEGVREEKIVRQPAVAGQFYPADPKELAKQIDEFLDKAETVSTEGDIFALIVPHAGYEFSGPVASWGFKQLAGKKIETVILIGSSHKESFEGISVFPSGFYKTPLGEVEVDSELAQKIIAADERIFFKESAHQAEHSLEVELPFLQKTLENFKIVPVIFGNSDRDDYKILARALTENIREKRVLLIASSDLSHYPSYEKARYADSQTIEAILTGKVEELEKTLKSLEKENISGVVTFACGAEAIKTVMLVAGELGAREIKLLNYNNSGDVEIGDKSRVVGYGSLGFFGPKPPPTAPTGIPMRPGLVGEAEQKKLLEIVRQSVEMFVRQKKIPTFEIDDPALNQKLGAFVTIKKQGQLRGCIGRFSPATVPLYQVVSQMAIAAATQDRRFNPVQINELYELHYEISVLSPMKKIDNWQEIELGKHGVQLQKGNHSGVFLPQVATENNWDLEKFMGELCYQKAGLERDCWKKNDVEISVFTAQVFEEE